MKNSIENMDKAEPIKVDQAGGKLESAQEVALKKLKKQEEENPENLKNSLEVTGEKIKNMENQEEVSFEDAKNFEDLFNLINRTDGIQGSEKKYEPAQLKIIIDKVINGEKGFNVITRTGGLRRKVHEILTEKFSFNKAESFDDLIVSLDKCKKIPGSSEGWDVAEIKKYIENIRNGKSINKLTRSCGLREKVNELLAKEIKE